MRVIDTVEWIANAGTATLAGVTMRDCIKGYHRHPVQSVKHAVYPHLARHDRHKTRGMHSSLNFFQLPFV